MSKKLTSNYRLEKNFHFHNFRVINNEKIFLIFLDSLKEK